MGGRQGQIFILDIDSSARCKEERERERLAGRLRAEFEIGFLRLGFASSTVSSSSNRRVTVVAKLPLFIETMIIEFSLNFELSKALEALDAQHFLVARFRVIKFIDRQKRWRVLAKKGIQTFERFSRFLLLANR